MNDAVGSAVILEQGPDGLRAKEYRQAADASYWDGVWERTSLSYGPAEAGHLPHQLRATAGRLRPPGRVLEAVCGMGHFTVAMSSRGFEAHGLDYASRIIELLNERYPSIPFVEADARASPYPDCYFDAVYSPGVCEHFEEGPDAVLADAFRVLRPGGVLFVSTPHLNALRRHRWRCNHADGDFYQYLFTGAGMVRTLLRLGFEVEHVDPYGVWTGAVIEWPALSRLSPGRAAGAFDKVPVLRRLGSTCIWTARRPK